MKRVTFFIFGCMMLASFNLYADDPCPGLKMTDKWIVDCTNEINSKNISNSRLATTYKNRAEAYNEKGEFDKALSDSNKALSLDVEDTNSDAFSARGLAWQGKGEYDKAIADYTTSIAVKSGTMDNFTRRGAAWALKGDVDKAIEDFNKALSLNSKNARAYYNRGLSWKLKGDYVKAISDYNDALRSNPVDPRALLKHPKNWDKLSIAQQANVLFEGLTFSGLISTNPPDVASVYEVQPTRFGNILIVGPRDGVGGASMILFNGKRVFDEMGHYLSFHGKFSIGNSDAILLGDNPGGHNIDSYCFILISANEDPIIAGAYGFYSEEGTLNPRKIKDRIVVNLGYDGGKRKTAELKSGKVVIHFDAGQQSH